jgi:hypothetical protein
VFRAWKPDTPAMIAKIVENDLESMNLKKLCPTAEDFSLMSKTITKKMSVLKQIHLDLLCETNIPPYISELDFVGFYRTCKLADQNLVASSIDLVYK